MKSHTMAGCQRGIRLSTLATGIYNYCTMYARGKLKGMVSPF